MKTINTLTQPLMLKNFGHLFQGTLGMPEHA